MRKKKQRHVKGERGKEFREKIKGLKGEEVIGVAIDISKDHPKVLIFDFTGEVMKGPFEMGVFKKDYEDLKAVVDEVMRGCKAKKLFWATEPTGPYHENLARHLQEDFGEVMFINPSAVYANRDQRMLKGLKTDDIDLGAIGDLLIRGEGYPFNLEEGVYLNLRERTYWREKKLKMQTQLKNQIRVRMEKIFPGLNSKYNDNKPLFSDFWKSSVCRGLMKVGLTPGEILRLSLEETKRRFQEVGHPLSTPWAEKIKDYLGKMLLPENEVLSVELELLKRDIGLLEALEGEMREVEERMVDGVKKTSGRHLLGKKIKGISDVMVASFIGAVGKVPNFSYGAQIFSKAGLTPKAKQSGNYQGKRLPIRRVGSKLLRTILFKIADSVKQHNPYFGLYYAYLTEKRDKFWKTAHIAVANKVNRVMFAMIRDEVPFDPPTAKIDYLEELFKQRKRKKKREREEKSKKETTPLDSKHLFYPSLESVASLHS